MELLLASLLIVLSQAGADHPDVSFDQLVQASLDSKNAIVQQAPPVLAATTHSDDRFRPINKKDPQKDAPKVKGVYVTAHSAAGARMSTLLKLMDETELNAMVIDIKDDWGYITYRTGNPQLEAMETTQKIIADMPQLMSTLQEHQIYPIARIVVFKDTILANKHPELSYINPDGSVWSNGKESFVNPYKKEVWDYNVNI